uniref:Pentatricopeptide repeat-containing protein n=1 Tax=Zea mays TaxID=4577 RepID=A0A804UAJ4_MAIZE
MLHRLAALPLPPARAHAATPSPYSSLLAAALLRFAHLTQPRLETVRLFTCVRHGRCRSSDKHRFVENSLIGAYVACGDVGAAEGFLSLLPENSQRGVSGECELGPMLSLRSRSLSTAALQLSSSTDLWFSP